MKTILTDRPNQTNDRRCTCNSASQTRILLYFYARYTYA